MNPATTGGLPEGDGSVGDLVKLDGFNRGVNAKADAIDYYELALVGGYEIYAHRTHVLIHLAYKVWSADVENRLPKFYQRLGVRQFVYEEWFVGLNVRFHEVGSADNLEWNAGYSFDL